MLNKKNWLCQFTYDAEQPPITVVIPETFEELCFFFTDTSRDEVDIRTFVLDENKYYSTLWQTRIKTEFNPRYLKYQNTFPSYECVTELLYNLFYNPTEDNSVKFAQFNEDLTISERIVLIAILKLIGEEGNISIVKCIQTIGYSRPVYDGLLNKLTKHSIAEIKGQGAKGTHIKFKMPICITEEGGLSYEI